MSDNIPKKLKIKAELLRHLETAQKQMDEGKVSSHVGVITLNFALVNFEFYGQDPELERWDAYLKTK